MIVYNIKEHYPRLKSKYLEENIVGHVYELENGNQYLFLGTGKYGKYTTLSDKHYLYIRMNILRKYLPDNYSNISEVLDNIITIKQSRLFEYICINEKPKKFVKDCGKLYDYKDEHFCYTYQSVLYGNFNGSDRIEFLNVDNIIDKIDDSKIIKDIKPMIKRKKKKYKVQYNIKNAEMEIESLEEKEDLVKQLENKGYEIINIEEV